MDNNNMKQLLINYREFLLTNPSQTQINVYMNYIMSQYTE